MRAVSAFWFWLIAAGAFTVAEILTLALFAAFLALGALGAALAALAGLSSLGQAIVFGVVGVVGILVARPLVLPWLHRPPWQRLASGAEGMIGQRGVLSDSIQGPDRPGHLTILGESWPALTGEGSPLPAGPAVRITGLRSTILIVEPIPETKSRGM